MADNHYQIILLGKLAEGFDPVEVKEKLAIVFEKTEKQIDKLFKKGKPIVVRKNLSAEFALRYKDGLEKLGVLCQMKEGGTSGGASSDAATLDSVTVTAENFRFKDLEESSPASVTLGEGTIRITAVQLSFGALAGLLVKLIFASIPALIILALLGIAIQQGQQLLL